MVSPRPSDRNLTHVQVGKTSDLPPTNERGVWTLTVDGLIDLHEHQDIRIKV